MILEGCVAGAVEVGRRLRHLTAFGAIGAVEAERERARDGHAFDTIRQRPGQRVGLDGSGHLRLQFGTHALEVRQAHRHLPCGEPDVDHALFGNVPPAGVVTPHLDTGRVGVVDDQGEVPRVQPHRRQHELRERLFRPDHRRRATLRQRRRSGAEQRGHERAAPRRPHRSFARLQHGLDSAFTDRGVHGPRLPSSGDTRAVVSNPPPARFRAPGSSRCRAG